MVLQPLLLALKGNPQVKYEKNQWYCLFLYFFLTTLDIIWPIFCSKITLNLILFAGFQWSTCLLGNSINIIILIEFPNKHTVTSFVIIKTLIWIQQFWKNSAKTSKNYYFLAQLVQNWGPHVPHPKQKTFFSEITKPDAKKLSEPFYFIKIPYVLAKLWMFFYTCVMLFC